MLIDDGNVALVAVEIENGTDVVCDVLEGGVVSNNKGLSLPGVDVPELRASIAEANEGAERVRRIVKDMKVLSRMDDDRIGVVDVEAALDASLNMAIHELRHRAQVVKDYGRVPLVRCNEGRLVQVFLNLLVNASQAIAGNGVLQSRSQRVVDRRLRDVVEMLGVCSQQPPPLAPADDVVGHAAACVMLDASSGHSLARRLVA